MHSHCAYICILTGCPITRSAVSDTKYERMGQKSMRHPENVRSAVQANIVGKSLFSTPVEILIQILDRYLFAYPRIEIKLLFPSF